MPSYTFRNIETEETITTIMTFDERDEFLKEPTDWKQTPSTPLIVSGVRSNLRRTDDAWKEVLGRVKRGSGKNNTVST